MSVVMVDLLPAGTVVASLGSFLLQIANLDESGSAVVSARVRFPDHAEVARLLPQR
jgi:hypothetical protein